MRDRQDAFGYLIYSRHKGESPMEVIERDDGYIDAADTSIYFSPHRKWPRFERQAIALARGRVLDVGCGAGRVCLHLQKRGLQVLGIDVSPMALKVCQERGVKKTRRISIAEVRPSVGLGQFDTIVMLGNNLALLGSRSRARRILKQFHSITRDKALILGSTVDPYCTTDPDHLRYHRFNRRRGRMAGQLRLRVLYHSRRTPWFDYLFVSQKELRSILKGSGWRLRQVIESGGPVYVAVIEKGA